MNSNRRREGPSHLDPGLRAAFSILISTCALLASSHPAAAQANLSTSTKCIDTVAPCGDGIGKSPGDPITYEFTICNTGAGGATDVELDDPLDFLSSTSARCIDLTSPTEVVNIFCTWIGPCGAPAADIQWNGVDRVTGSIPLLPAGECVVFDVTAFVDPTFDGDCTNTWQLEHGMPPMPVTVNSPVFRPRALTGLTGAKCIDDGLGNCAPGPVRGPGDTVRYIIDFELLGPPEIRDVRVSDLTPACVEFTGSLRCEPDPMTCGTASCAVNREPPMLDAVISHFPPGCKVRVSFDTTVSPGASGICCNEATASWEDPVPMILTTNPSCFEARVDGEVDVEKELTGPSVPIGGQSEFTIDVTNTVGFDLTECLIVDDVFANRCMTLDMSTGCTLQGPAPPNWSLDCGVTTPDFITATFDLPLGFSFAFTIPVIAGALGQDCDNVVEVNCSAAASDTDVATLRIIDAGCDVARVIDPAPVERLPPPWHYTNSCGPSDLRLDPSDVVARFRSLAVDTTVPSAPGAGGELQLLQLDCGCMQPIYLVKTPGGVVRIEP